MSTNCSFTNSRSCSVSALASDDDDILRHLEKLDALRVELHVVERIDQIQLVVQQHLGQLPRAGDEQFRLHAGAAAVKFRQNLLKTGHEDGLDGADAQGSGKVPVLYGEGHGLGCCGDDVPCVGDKLLPVMGDGHVFADAVEQAHAQLVFKLLHLNGDGRLRIAERLGRFGKAL